MFLAGLLCHKVYPCLSSTGHHGAKFHSQARYVAPNFLFCGYGISVLWYSGRKTLTLKYHQTGVGGCISKAGYPAIRTGRSEVSGGERGPGCRFILNGNRFCAFALPANPLKGATRKYTKPIAAEYNVTHFVVTKSSRVSIYRHRWLCQERNQAPGRIAAAF